MGKTDIVVAKLLEEWAKVPKIEISKLTPEIVREGDKDVIKLQEPVNFQGEIEEYQASTPKGKVPIKVYTPKSCLDRNNNPLWLYSIIYMI